MSGLYIVSLLINLYEEPIRQNARLDDSHGRFKIARRNISNFRYTDDTILIAEIEKGLKSFLMRVKEESEKVGLKFNIQKMETFVSSPITSWQIEGERVEAETGFLFLGSEIPADGDCSRGIRR